MKKKGLRIALEVGVLIAIIVAFVLINEIIIDNRKSTFVPKGDSNYYAYQVENAYVEDDYFIVDGWFFELQKVQNVEHEVNSDNTPCIVIFDLNSDVEEHSEKDNYKKGICLDTRIIKRQDINSYFDCEYDYSNCGFVAKIKKTKIDCENGKYQIIIKPDENAELGIQAAYLINGRISYIAPSNVYELSVENTDLEKIVNQGICLISNPEYHICVYQYGWKLFWIADEGFDFEEDATTFVQYQIDTTQFDRLPQERINNKWYWDYIGTNFEDDEVTNEMNCGKYRVYVRDLPVEYAMTRAWTGYYIDGKWIWKQFIRPDYRLRKTVLVK